MPVTSFKAVWMPAVLTAVMPLALAAQPAPAPQAPPPPPTPEVAQVMKLMGGGSFLGVGVREIDAERAKALNLREEFGVEVTKVEPDSPADKAGLKVGDVVQEYQGQRVEGTEQFVRMVRETPAGRNAKMTVVRGGSQQNLTATIAARKAPKAWAMSMPKIDMPDKDFQFTMPDVPKAMMSWRSGMIGIEGESLGDSQFATFFGVKEGVLVRSVIKGSAAEKAGIKAGDVITKVDTTQVTSPRDVTSAMRNARSASKKSISVSLVREKREMTLNVTLDDEPTGFNYTAPRGRSISVSQDQY